MSSYNRSITVDPKNTTTLRWASQCLESNVCFDLPLDCSWRPQVGVSIPYRYIHASFVHLSVNDYKLAASWKSINVSMNCVSSNTCRGGLPWSVILLYALYLYSILIIYIIHMGQSRNPRGLGKIRPTLGRVQNSSLVQLLNNYG